ncbi:MAG: hypothetical protein KatS3mg017_0435 [Fimbriimonadales bacterium]|nr:MAG: hypothetical protein KatS3mg017_0435 [Fimbriimonadales bacterium]
MEIRGFFWGSDALVLFRIGGVQFCICKHSRHATTPRIQESKQACANYPN